jgi:hypothetical protein
MNKTRRPLTPAAPECDRAGAAPPSPPSPAHATTALPPSCTATHFARSHEVRRPCMAGPAPSSPPGGARAPAAAPGRWPRRRARGRRRAARGRGAAALRRAAANVTQLTARTRCGWGRGPRVGGSGAVRPIPLFPRRQQNGGAACGRAGRRAEQTRAATPPRGQKTFADAPSVPHRPHRTRPRARPRPGPATGPRCPRPNISPAGAPRGHVTEPIARPRSLGAARGP